VILLFAVTMIEGYYMEHPVVIPLWARALIVTGALVKLYSVRIVLGTAVAWLDLRQLPLGSPGSELHP